MTTIILLVLSMELIMKNRTFLYYSILYVLLFSTHESFCVPEDQGEITIYNETDIPLTVKQTLANPQRKFLIAGYMIHYFQQGQPFILQPGQHVSFSVSPTVSSLALQQEGEVYCWTYAIPTEDSTIKKGGEYGFEIEPLFPHDAT